MALEGLTGTKRLAEMKRLNSEFIRSGKPIVRKSAQQAKAAGKGGKPGKKGKKAAPKKNLQQELFPGTIQPEGYDLGMLQQFTPEQMDMLKGQYEQLKNKNTFLSRLAEGQELPELNFEEIEAPALRQFSELQGGLGSRFSDMGLGAQGSSGFKNALNTAASDFAQQLQSQRQGLSKERQELQLQRDQLSKSAAGDLWDMSQGFLSQRPYEQFLIKKGIPPEFLKAETEAQRKHEMDMLKYKQKYEQSQKPKEKNPWLSLVENIIPFGKYLF